MRNMDLLVSVICLLISTVSSAPLLQFLQPYSRIAVQPQQNLQQQLLELQTMEHLSQLSPLQINPGQPLLILIPDQTLNNEVDSNQINKDRIDNKVQFNDNSETKDEDDSVVIDAEPVPILEEQKAVLILPSGRFSIGGIISAIPFLPIEINVPDTISWAYNGIAEGISSIIAIIGSRLPFQRPSQEMTSGVKLKTMINDMQLRNKNIQQPIVILPLNGIGRPMVPLLL